MRHDLATAPGKFSLSQLPGMFAFHADEGKYEHLNPHPSPTRANLTSISRNRRL